MKMGGVCVAENTNMKAIALVGGTVGALLALSQLAYADSTRRVACLPTNGKSADAYWQYCPVDPVDPTRVHSCGCADGFAALDLFQIQEGSTTGSGPKITPVSASPG